jgi:tRNA A-37 threonylcarbamoyl transferase component Bud32
MAGEPEDLDKLFESVADGESVDWDALERDAPDEESRTLIRQLRLIAEVAQVHRSQVDEAPVDDATVPVPSALQGGTWPPPRLPHVATAPAPGEGGSWGHLLMVRKIGEGSYGEVYHAHDTWLDHPVALKLLKPEAESRVHPSDLLHEARKLARVRHVNVVTVHGADRHDGRVGFWMDFIDGETLATRVARGRMSAGEAVSVGQEVCRALAAVHQAKLIHRDVKAQNVMRAHDGGRIILMDFGAGEFLDGSAGSRAQGTPLYLAPELLRGESASVRTDIYAAGVLLYYLVTGSFPVEAASPAALVEAHERGQRRRLRDERPDLPESFIAIVERAIDPDPARRYASAGEMEAKLAGEPITKPEPVSQPPRPVPMAPASSIPKRVITVLAGAAITTAILGFVASRFFEVVLQVDRDFWFGFVDTFTIGLNGLFPYIVLWLFGGAVLASLAALRTLLPKSILSRLGRLNDWLNAADPARVATSICLLGVVSCAAVNLIVYSDLFDALYALRESPSNESIDFAILGPDRNTVRLSHLLISVYLSMFLGLAVWQWFPRLETRSDAATVRMMKWATLIVAFIVVGWDVMPRRIIWETHPVVEFDGRTRFVIASTGDEPDDELLLYMPDQPDQPRVRVRRATQGLRYLNENRWLFGRDGQQSGRSR